MPRNCSRPHFPAAITLIEVVVAIGLLTTLLVGMLTTFSRHADQVRSARKMTEAIQAADGLMYEWMRDESKLPRRGRGNFAGDDDLHWDTGVVDRRHLTELGIETIRLRVWQRVDNDDRVLLELDFVMPAPNWPPIPKASGGEGA